MGRQCCGRRFFFLEAIETVLQDFAQRFEREIGVTQRQSGGVFQTLLRIMFLEIQNPQTRPITLFGMSAAVDDGLNESSRMGTGLVRTADESVGAPFRIFAMGRRHMLFEGGVPMGQIASDMAGHALSLSQDLDGVSGKPDVELLPSQFIGHAVVVIVDIDMIIDVDGGDLPLGVLVGFLHQGQSVGLIEE